MPLVYFKSISRDPQERERPLETCEKNSRACQRLTLLMAASARPAAWLGIRHRQGPKRSLEPLVLEDRPNLLRPQRSARTRCSEPPAIQFQNPAESMITAWALVCDGCAPNFARSLACRRVDRHRAHMSGCWQAARSSRLSSAGMTLAARGSGHSGHAMD